MSNPSYLPPVGGRGLRLLSLDGGGVRALSSLIILREIMNSIDQNNPPRPCDYFDMIGGSETGGLIAIMLGRLGMGIDECIDTFSKAVKRIYQPPSSRLLISISSYLQSKFSTSELQQVIQELISERLHDANALLLNKESPCKVFVTASSPSTTNTILLRSYKNPRSVNEATSSTATIWQAAQATMAIPTMFDPIEIAGEKLIAGALAVNNPIQQLWLEATDLWTEKSLNNNISCMISIGSGVQSIKLPSGTISTTGPPMTGLFIEAEKTSESFLLKHIDLFKDYRYVRLSVTNGLDSIGLDEIGVEDKVLSLTRNYMRDVHVAGRINDCAKYLANEQDYRRYMVLMNSSGRDEGMILAELTQRTFQGMGSWIFKDISFKKWISGKTTQSLWIHGGSGSGKTTLATSIIQEISTKLPNDPSRPEPILGFFFCSYIYISRNNATSIVRSLIYQMLRQRPDLYANLRHGQKLVDRYPDSSIPFDVLAADFTDLLNSPGPGMIYFVLDGLDECNQKSIDQFFELVNPYLSIGKRYSDAGELSTLKWLFMSENIPSIARHLEAIPDIALEAQAPETSSDVEDAIDEALKKLTQLPNPLSPELGEFIRGYLRETARGSVSWVKFVCDKLQTSADSSPKSVTGLLLGNSPLLWAASMGLENVVQILLGRGADIGATDSNGSTALILASEYNHLETASLLIEEGSDADAKRADGLSALQIAVNKGHKDIVELLLRSGADPTLITSLRETVIRRKMARATSGTLDEISRLLQERPLVQGPGSLDPGSRTEADFLSRPKLPDSYHSQSACNFFTTYVVDFFDLEDQQPREWRIEERLSVYDLIYGQGAEKIMASLRSSTVKDPVFRWYHLPANNLAWALMCRILHDRRARTIDFDDQVKEQLGMARSSGFQHRGTTPHSCYMRPLCQEISFGPQEGVMLFMPYLDFESNEGRAKLAASIEKMKTAIADTALPPQELKKMPDSIDDDLIQGYLRSYPGWTIPPLHVRRTLDQYFYNELKDTSKRDTDQVVFRYTKKHTPNSIKIFMVDQLWMWVLDNHTIITSCPQRWGQPSTETSPPDIFNFVLLQLRSKTRSEILSVQDLAMLITNCCTRTFGRYRIPRIPDEYQFFDMFESSIGSVSDRETKAFDTFKENVANANPKMKANVREEALDALFDIREETEILTEIKDIRDELKILKRVLEEQKEVAEKLFSMYERSTPNITNPTALLGMNKIHKDHIDEMDKRAADIYDSVNHLLNLKQKQTNAAEARFARQQTEDTSRQGQTVLVFTIVTIVFGLLSFMTALFALNIVEYPRDSNGYLQLDYVAKYTFGIAIGVSVPLVLIAIYIPDITDWFSRAKLRALKAKSAPIAVKVGQKPVSSTLAKGEKGDKKVVAVLPATVQVARKRKALGDIESGSSN